VAGGAQNEFPGAGYMEAHGHPAGQSTSELHATLHAYPSFGHGLKWKHSPLLHELRPFKVQSSPSSSVAVFAVRK
jgi:hypothetical protein